MYYLQADIVILLFGLSHVCGFLQLYPRMDLHEGFYSINKDDFPVTESVFWVEQQVDHFNQADKRTWRQRYINNTEYWKPGGPILVLLTCETRFYSYFSPTEMSVNHIAKEINAAIFKLELRFNELSMPLEEFTLENLALRSTKQALADSASFIKFLKGFNAFSSSKVIVVGGSYGGNLATYMKMEYPNLLDAAVASSAVLLAKKDFSEYVESVTDAFRTYGSQECVDAIRNIFNRYLELFKTEEGIKKVKEEENICESDDFTLPETQQHFLLARMNSYAYYTLLLNPQTIKKNCGKIVSGENNSFLTLTPNRIFDTSDSCFGYDYKEVVDGFNQTTLPDAFMWIYQTCTEFGQFINTDTNSNTMFGASVPLGYHIKLCKVLFGDKFDEEKVDESVINTNKIYGGLHPNVSKVVFVYGEIDPFNKLGVTHDLSPDAPVVSIKGGTHCSDLRAEKADDSEELKEARKRVISILKDWIEPKEK